MFKKLNQFFFLVPGQMSKDVKKNTFFSIFFSPFIKIEIYKFKKKFKYVKCILSKPKSITLLYKSWILWKFMGRKPVE